MANQKGTQSHDILRGTIFNDLIEGLAGDDKLYGLDGNDVLRGGDGFDVLTGDTGNDTLDGGALDDWLYGGVGNDVLTGGTGADRFVFETALNATANVDRITDFTTGSDKIWLNYSVFNKLTVNGALNASMLRIGSAAADSNDYIIYNKNTGALIYDSNGNAAGGAVQFATIGKGLDLTANDFNVFGAPATGTMTPTPIPPTSSTGVVTKVGTGSDTLTLKITQDAYQGDSQYAVYVDGVQIGGTFTANALHNSGQSDTLEIKGDWGMGNHTVSVRLLNDAWGGSATTDRNVYIESATYNVAAVPGSSLFVNDGTTKSFSVYDSAPIPGTEQSPPPPPPPPTDEPISLMNPFSDASPWNTAINWSAVNPTSYNAPVNVMLRNKALGNTWIMHNGNDGMINDTQALDPYHAWHISSFNQSLVGGSFSSNVTKSIQTPVNMTATHGSDHWAIWDIPGSTQFYEGWLVDPAAHTAAYVVQNDLNGIGWGTRPGVSAGIRASGASLLGGMIDTEDMATGVIDHALSIQLDGDQLKKAATQAEQMVGPATTVDGNSLSTYQGLIPMGARFAIPTWVNIENAGLTREGKMLAKAYQVYGGYVVDRTDYTTSIADTSGLAQQQLDNLFRDMQWIRDQLIMI